MKNVITIAAGTLALSVASRRPCRSARSAMVAVTKDARRQTSRREALQPSYGRRAAQEEAGGRQQPHQYARCAVRIANVNE